MTPPETFKPVRSFVFCLAVATLLGMLSTVSSVRAQTQDFRGIDARMERLEKDLKDMQRFVYREGGVAAPAGATPLPEPSRIPTDSADPVSIQIADRLFQFEKDLRRLTGDVEQISWQMDQVSNRLDNLVKDMDFRLQALEQNRLSPAVGADGMVSAAPVALAGPNAGQPPLEGGLPRSGREPGVNITPGGEPGVLGSIPAEQQQQLAPLPQATATVAPAAPLETSALNLGGVLPTGSTRDQYNFAAALMARGDYVTARTAFIEFLAKNPEDRLAGNAQYWLGETYYTEKNFPKAAESFLIGMQKYGDGSKGPDNMLKLGMTLMALNQKEEACTTLTALPGRYPDAPINILSRADNERTQAQCP